MVDVTTRVGKHASMWADGRCGLGWSRRNVGPPAALGFAECQAFFQPWSVRAYFGKSLIPAIPKLPDRPRKENTGAGTGWPQGGAPSQWARAQELLFKLCFRGMLQAFHFLMSYLFGQGSQISHLWNRVGLLLKIGTGWRVNSRKIRRPGRDPGKPRCGLQRRGVSSWLCFLVMCTLALCLALGLGQQWAVPAHLPCIEAVWFMPKGFWKPRDLGSYHGSATF